MAGVAPMPKARVVLRMMVNPGFFLRNLTECRAPRHSSATLSNMRTSRFGFRTHRKRRPRTHNRFKPLKQRGMRRSPAVTARVVVSVSGQKVPKANKPEPNESVLRPTELPRHHANLLEAPCSVG